MKGSKGGDRRARRDFLTGTSSQVTGGAILALLVSSVPAAAGNLVVVVAIAAGTTLVALPVAWWSRRRKRARSLRKDAGRSPVFGSTTSEASKIGELTRFSVPSASFDLRIDTSNACRSDSEMKLFFAQLNTARQAHGLLPHYDAVRYMPVRDGDSDADGIKSWSVVPVDFSLLALISDPLSPPEARNAAEEVLRSALGPVMPNGTGEIPERRGVLGVQVCLITSDGRVLLRKRGTNVLFARDRWDVSASGFCGTGDVVDGRLDPGLTVVHEVEFEIGPLRGDPRRIHLLGLFTNNKTGAVDILSAWPLDSPTDDVVAALAIESISEGTVFDTEKRAVERYVWDAKNLIVPFSSTSLRTAFRTCGIYGDDFEPQSLLCLTRSLEHTSGEKIDLATMEHRPPGKSHPAEEVDTDGHHSRQP